MWVSKAMGEVAAAKLFPRHTHILLMNKTELKRRMESARTAFDATAVASPHLSFLHTFAVKANPLQAVLEVVRESGFGAETASIGEFMMAEKVFGSTKGAIVFDSPAKTLEELHTALQVPCYLNVDNFEELDRIIALYEGKIDGFARIDTVQATIGIRVNPQTVTTTGNMALATGGLISKFGVSLRDPGNKEKIIHYFEKYHKSINLAMIHVHSGSQGLSLDTMVAGVRTIVEDLVDDPRLAPLIDVVDIGGGFPVNFASDDEQDCTISHYATALQANVPTLFAPTQARTIITEFGRSIAAKSGVLISRVEYVKQSGGRQIILQHIGADLAVRTVWQPEKWPLRVFIYDEHGVLKEPIPSANRPGTDDLTDVAGPCCNSGCTLARAAHLPTSVVPLHDLVVVHDVGAYYHSSFSLYNLRQMPACYMYDEEALSAQQTNTLVCFKPPQSAEDTIKLFETD